MIRQTDRHTNRQAYNQTGIQTDSRMNKKQIKIKQVHGSVTFALLGNNDRHTNRQTNQTTYYGPKTYFYAFIDRQVDRYIVR